jgi:branched-chain amino acid transport system ATP-binding protein
MLRSGFQHVNFVQSVVNAELLNFLQRESDVGDRHAILETRGLSKEFNGFVAVSDVNLRFEGGAIHAIIGPNGAGKTTFFNLLTKFQAPTSGHIFFKGVDITHVPPARIARSGIIRSFQISAVFPHLTALENVRVGLQSKAGVGASFWQSARVLDRFNGRAMEILETVGLGKYADIEAAGLPYGRKRALEIATTLALEPELMLLDEPTQGMGHEDVDSVKELIRSLGRSRAILIVEHNMKVVADISDTITVLQRGRVLAHGGYAEVSANPEVIEAYLGDSDGE